MCMYDSTQPTQIRFQAAVFTADELCRLAAYKAAIDAGFYTDDCAETNGGLTTPIWFAHHTPGATDSAN